MEYTLDLRTTDRIVIVRATGNFTKAEGAIMGVEGRQTALDHGFGVLFDFRETVAKVSTTDAYNWELEHYDSLNVELSRVPTAFLSRHDEVAFWQFVENVCVNRGHPVRSFTDEARAIAWLKDIQSRLIPRKMG